MKFNADFQAVPYVASKVDAQRRRLGVDLHDPQGLEVVGRLAVHARDFEWSWKRQLDPASKAPYAGFLYDIKGAEAFNKGKVTGRRAGRRARPRTTGPSR